MFWNCISTPDLYTILYIYTSYQALNIPCSNLWDWYSSCSSIDIQIKIKQNYKIYLYTSNGLGKKVRLNTGKQLSLGKYVHACVGQGAQWALEHGELILKSQIWNIWKWAQSQHSLWLTTFMIAIGLFQTVWVHIWEIYYCKFKNVQKRL